MAEVEADVIDDTPVLAFEDTTQPADTSLVPTTTSTDLVVPADGTVEKVRKTKIIKRKRRPARAQQDPSTFKTEPPAQTGTIFNMYVKSSPCKLGTLQTNTCY